METIVCLTMEECCHTCDGKRDELKPVARLKLKIKQFLMNMWLDLQLQKDNEDYKSYKLQREENKLREKELNSSARVYSRIQNSILNQSNK